MRRFDIIIGVLFLYAGPAAGKGFNGQDSTGVKTLEGNNLQNVTVSAHKSGRSKGLGIANSDMINAKELLRAACCNLGESFTTNPSVDVNYADAATGAQQIKLLGLSGTYVQMLTENIPN